ncbi:MAG: hypothetical protein J2P45_14745 [Candidatus Dormibacteraeota bacterium]|nr:hypothetical protein [Candidatus Dormibacteraeota bacterium]
MKVLTISPGSGRLAALRSLRRERPQVVVAPLSGGVAGLGLAGCTLVSLLLAPPPARRGSGFRRRWMERRQARRSALLLAPDRSTAVSCALRWNLDLARIRVVSGLEGDLEAHVRRELGRLRPEGRAWHSA